MRAMVINRFGGPEVLEKADLPRPSISEREVLIRIQAAGVNPVDWKIRKGLFEGRMPYEFPIILGWDCAGVVIDVGSEFKKFKKGDEVMAYTRKEMIHDGTYAEYIALEEKHLALKPKNLSFEEAAAIPLAGLTAYQSLFESIQLQSGETILIHAGAGGVGGFAIQLAKNAGARVITTASTKNHDYVKSLGVDEVIDYAKADFVQTVKAKYPEGLDAVFDTVGGETQKKSAGVLKKGGRVTSILAIDAEYFEKQGLVPGYVFVRPDADQLEQLKVLAEKGILKVHLSARFPLEEAAKALNWVESGHGRGKIVLSLH